MIYLVIKTDSEGELLIGACSTVEEADDMIVAHCKLSLKLAMNAAYGKELHKREKIFEKTKHEIFGGYSVVSAG